MSYEARQTRRFSPQYKKLRDNIAVDADDAVAVISTNPKLGERKKGDLADLFVYKFRSQDQLYLLGYTADDGIRLVYLEAISSHENFYRNLKR